MNKRFLRSLHEEHLEEISALYERRIAYLDDTEIDLDDLAYLESRLEAHLDALVVGAEPALELCTERAADGDAGEFFGALCVFCRQGRYDLLEAALVRVEQDDDDEPEIAAAPAEDDEPDEELDGGMMAAAAAEAAREQADEESSAPEDDEDEDEDEYVAPTTRGAMADALRFEAPANWQPLYVKLLAHPHPAIRAAVAPLVAHHGLKLGPQLVEAAGRPDAGPGLAPLLAALGRLRERSGGALLGRHAQRPSSDEAPIATLALLRFGDASIIEHTVGLTSSHPWATSLVAISGGASHAPVILARLARAEVADEEVIAAGLFGDTTAVPRLLECLDQGTHPAAVAQALYLLTGAPLYETVIEPVEDIEPTAAPAAEGEATAEGEPAAAEPATPDPRDEVEIVRLSEDPIAWRQWWEQHQGAFERGKRYRLGQLASPVVLGQTLTCFVLRRPVRQLAAEEIGLRYRPKTDLDVDMRAHVLRAALAALPSLRDGDAVLSRADGAWVFARALAR